MEKKLSDFQNGDSGIIVKVLGEGRLRHRLFDMGITPGANVIMIKRSPLGDPLEINIRGYALTLRKTEADNVILNIKEEDNK